MVIRFTIGLYALVALAVLVLAACGGDDESLDGGDATETPVASVVSTESPSPTVINGDLCPEMLISRGAETIVGRAVEVSRAAPGTEFENMIVVVDVDDSAFVSGQIQVVLLGGLITDVDVGDCVSVAGEEQRWACGPDCEDLGFVASLFEIIEAE